MKKLMVVLAILAIASVAQAEILATWNFFGSNSTMWPGVAPVAGANLAANIESAELTFGPTFTATTSASGLRGNGVTWGGTGRTIALGDTSYIQISLEAADGFTLTVTDISGIFSGSASGVGGTDRWSAQADGGGYAFVIDAQTTVNGSRNFDITDTTGVTVDLRYYNSPTAAAGTYGFLSTTTANHGIVINGTTQSAAPIPEPATMALLGIGGLALALRRKIRK